jgi:hypothetical protein
MRGRRRIVLELLAAAMVLRDPRDVREVEPCL